MKEIMAIIRINRVNETRKALANAGFCGMHAVKALGRGKAAVEYFILNNVGLREEYGSLLEDSLANGGRLIPKRLFTLLVLDGSVDLAVKTIISVNSTGQPGDGKIFVCPIEDVVRIRTGECGEIAI